MPATPARRIVRSPWGLAVSAAAALLCGAVAGQGPQPCLVEDGDGTVLVGPRVTQVNLEYAVKLQNGASALDVTAAEIFTGLRRGDTGLALHRHDPSVDQPGARIVSGIWWQSEAVGWQGVRFPFTVTIQPGEVFWLVWESATGSQLPVARVDRIAGDIHRTRQNRSLGAWSAPRREWDWKIRLDCGGRRPGQFLTLGFPCGAGGFVPELGSDQPVPVVGNVFTLELESVRPATDAWLGFGTTSGRWAGQLLPFDLTPFGAPGCQVGADLVAGALARADAAGRAAVPLAVPGQPALVGAVFYAQWVSLDPAANPLGVLTSLTGELRVGN